MLFDAVRRLSKRMTRKKSSVEAFGLILIIVLSSLCAKPDCLGAESVTSPDRQAVQQAYDQLRSIHLFAFGGTGFADTFRREK